MVKRSIWRFPDSACKQIKVMSMRKCEILRDQWTEFFRTFTTDYATRLVNFGADLKRTHHQTGDKESRELPLRDITADPKDGENTLVISVNLTSERVLQHAIRWVAHVWVTQTDTGSVVALDIESKNGQTTTLNVSGIIHPSVC
jgi:Family of unknown function (DUF5335)